MPATPALIIVVFSEIAACALSETLADKYSAGDTHAENEVEHGVFGDAPGNETQTQRTTRAADRLLTMPFGRRM